MGRIFILLGKTGSYKEFVKERCAHNQMLNCTDVSKIDTSQVNVVTGNIKDYTELVLTYGDIVHPVYIYTPDYQILQRGIDNAMHNGGNYSEVCETFISECKEYSPDELKRIGAVEIAESNDCDAYIMFMDYMRDMLTKDHYEVAVGGTLC